MDETGKVRVRTEVTKIERERLEASLFVVPASYRTVTPNGLQR